MAFAPLTSRRAFIGYDIGHLSEAGTTMDAANEAAHLIGQIITSDGGSHTLDTSGSSSIGWRAGTTTFADGATTVKVGIADVNMTAGQPGRAVNVANVITFDVSKTLTGGGGGITSTAWQTHVPDSGTKTIANGDFVAVCVQMTARGGSDSVVMSHCGPTAPGHPGVTGYTGGSYAFSSSVPNVFLTFSDGATGWMFGGAVYTTFTTRTWNSTSSPNEYGQLFSLPFPVRVIGLYAQMTAADVSGVLYSDPLGTPVAERTHTLDTQTFSNASSRRSDILFSSPYDVPANTPIAAVIKPTTASNVSALFKTISSADHRVVDAWGTSGYGVSRSGGAGAFADANSSLDHYYIGLIVGAFDDGVSAGGHIASRQILGM